MNSAAIEDVSVHHFPLRLQSLSSIHRPRATSQ
jgi:hypothetical protein